MTKNPIYSFIIPVYNTGNYLLETLDSIANQNFDLNTFQVIVIDDCSTDENTKSIINKLIIDNNYKGLKLEIIQNKSNKWLAETRNIGAKIATGKYLVCLDSDDTIEKDFIKYIYLAFGAYPNASWVYPSVRKFGAMNKQDIVENFSAKNLFLTNYCVAVSPLKRELWEQLGGQRTYKISPNIKLYEDWDFWQRALGKAKFGVPIKKIIFNYRQNISSLISRSENEGNLSTLLSYRKNWTSIFGLKYADKNYKKDNDNFTNNFGIFSKLARKIIKKISNRNPSNLRISDILLFIFAPSIFTKRKINSNFTKAHKMAGFTNGFQLDIDKNLSPSFETKNTAMCAHFWWHIGGAENILLDYIKSLSPSCDKIVDVVNLSAEKSGTLRKKFANVSTEQFALDEIADGAYPRLLALWELIKLEQPKIILNMSNPFLYLLSPLIKEKFPNTIIYDLLHCEDFEDNGWFEAAYNFQNYIDIRIVISPYWKKILIEKYKEKENKIKVIYNMVNFSAFKNSHVNKEESLNKLNIKKGKKIIGFLGRFQQQKRPDLFVALAEKMQNNSDFHFIMAGDGEDYELLSSKIKNLDNLTYLGATNSPEKIIPLFDVGIFPSLYEGYAIITMEAAISAVPVIVPNITGFKEQIENGNFGLMYDVKGDAEDLDAIEKILLENYEALTNLGLNGPKFIQKYHNEIEIKESLFQLFNV